MKIDLPFISTNLRRNINLHHHYIELGEVFITYSIDIDYEFSKEGDEYLWTEDYSVWDWVRKKSDISNISMSYITTVDNWWIEMDFHGVYGEPKAWYFETKGKCKEVYDKLIEYWKS